ncbi:S41 family peptidase [Rhizobium leguminosarum]|uniref:S41 family peptidase n=1 Tax=Rhizobium leguminosarum TaxID=384 RepID=UPI0013F16585|nr:S41 family peptidase [Rhizobium leguminosarum]
MTNDKLWSHGLHGGTAKRVTASTITESSPAISPDGKRIAYVATDETSSEVFLAELDTGEVRRLTYDDGTNVKVRGWLSNKEIVFSTTIKSQKRGALLWIVDIGNLAQRVIPLTEASEGCLADKSFIFVKNEELIDNVRYYRGGYAQQIYKIDKSILTQSARRPLESVSATMLTSDNRSVNRSPVCYGRTVYFLSSRSGRFNIWSMDDAGRNLIQHTFENEFDVRSVAAVDDTHLIYEMMGDAYILDVRSGQAKKLTVQMPTNSIEKVQVRKLKLNEATELAIGEDITKFFAVVNGKIWHVDTKGKSSRCLYCTSSSRAKSLTVTENASSVLALLDSGGEYAIYKIPLETELAPTKLIYSINEPLLDFSASSDGRRLLVRSISGNLYYVDIASGRTDKIILPSRTKPESITWSRDGNYASFITYTDNDIGQVAIFDASCLTVESLSSGQYEASFPAFSADSKRIYFLAETNFRSSVSDPWAPRAFWPDYQRRALLYSIQLPSRLQERGSSKGAGGVETPTDEIDRNTCGKTEGENGILEHQLATSELPFTAANYVSLLSVGDGLFAISKAAARDVKGKLVGFYPGKSIARGSPATIFNDDTLRMDVSADRKSIIGVTGKGIFVSSVSDSGQLSEPRYLKDVDQLAVSVDLSFERRQMFNEVWRLYRDYFWDSKMLGHDWNAIRSKYSPFLSRVSNRSELNELMSSMIAELGTGHTSIRAPSSGGSGKPSVGKLGATLSGSNEVMVDNVFDGDLDLAEERSPLSSALPRVESGDAIIRVNGISVHGVASIDRILEGRVGETIKIDVRKSDGFTVATWVVPISAWREASLRYKHWVATNRHYVEEMSGGEVGYIHLRASNEADLANLIRYLPMYQNRKGLILDLRGNNGGNVDPWVFSVLQRAPWLYLYNRYDRLPMKSPRDSFGGKLVVLIDGDTYSDGEAIAEGVRRLGLGILMGSRTSGAGVWINDDKTLVDGGSVRIPETASYVIEEGRQHWVIEGEGVQPDVIVENDPYLVFLGHDDQLDASVRMALRGSVDTRLLISTEK